MGHKNKCIHIDASNDLELKYTFSDFMIDAIYTSLRVISCILIISIIIVGTYEIPNVFSINNIDNDYIHVIDNFYVSEDNYADDAEELNDFIETLPPIFIKEFRKHWKVVIEDYIAAPNNNIIIAGCADWHSRTIFIKREINYTDTLNTFVHELGHCFNFEYGLVSYSTSFENIYDLYKDDFIEQYTNSPNGYSVSSTTEFFAACFKEYMLCPDHLIDVAPKAYEFVDNFYKDVQKIKYIYVYDLGSVANIISTMSIYR